MKIGLKYLCIDQIHQNKFQVDSIFDHRIMKDRKLRFSVFVGLFSVSSVLSVSSVSSVRPFLVHVPQTKPQQIQVWLMARSTCMSQEQVIGHV